MRSGRSITFESGPAANRHVLTKQYIFNSWVAPGRAQMRRLPWVTSCIAAIRQTRAEPVFDTSSKAYDRAARPMAAHSAWCDGSDGRLRVFSRRGALLFFVILYPFNLT